MICRSACCPISKKQQALRRNCCTLREFVNLSDCLVESDGWTNDLSLFRQWLDEVQMAGGGRSDSALAEALSEALFLFKRPSQLGDMQACSNHLLLMMSSEPHRLPVPWPFHQSPSEVGSDQVHYKTSILTSSQCL